MFLTLILCLLLTINVNCNQWDGYHRQIDDKLPAISWKECGISARKSDPTLIPEVSTRIQGGELAKSGEFPWFAFITAYSPYQITCGGSILNEWWVLTAAHCVEEFRVYGKEMIVFVTIGLIHSHPGKGHTIYVERVIIHDKYVQHKKVDDERKRKNEILKGELIQWEVTDRERNKDFEDQLLHYERIRRVVPDYIFYDIALLKLKEKIVPVFNETHYTINSICLPKTGIVNTKNENMMIIGMGLESPKPETPISDTLKKGVALLLDPNICGNWNASDVINPVICFNRNNRSSLPLFNSSVCGGDSGSPSHQYYGWQAVQIGIADFAYPDENFCGTTAIYDRVSLFTPWIRSFISGTDARLEVQTNHLLIVSVITFVTIAVIISSVFLWILVKILRDRHRNRNDYL